MRSKKALLENSRLYLIADRKACARLTLPQLKALCEDVDIIQLRDKDASIAGTLEYALFLRKAIAKDAIFIVNDDVEIAKIADADGVHLGQKDISVGLARKILGPDKMIGVSCSTIGQAKKAQREGADYLGIGPVFKTDTKTDARANGLGPLRSASRSIKIPFFALGGINGKNIKSVLSCGVKRVAVCAAICKSAHMARSAKGLKRLLD